MVRVSGQGSKIAGGFVLVSASSLMGVWRSGRGGSISSGDFRVWLACHEMRARRCAAPPGRSVSYTPNEASKLCGVVEKRIRGSLRRLVSAGFLEWSKDSIGFPDQGLEDRHTLEDTIGRGLGSLAIPRRVLRLLAGGARPALIATTLGILLRCLSRRRDGFEGRGRVKASWIARVFGVDVRRVKAARAELIGLGWIESEPGEQRVENRYGRAFRIDLAWARVPSRQLPPPEVIERHAIATPSVNPEPLPERKKDQEPADRGPAGVDTNSVQTGMKSVPSLDDVQPQDLRDAGRMLELHRQAVERKLTTSSEADRLRVLTIAEHAAVIGTRNPAGLFVRLLKGKLWHFATADDEDAARRRLRAHLWPVGPSPAAPASPAKSRSSTLSDDARMVREVSRALMAAGYRGDPFPQVRRLDPGWTRERWDVARAELAGREPANANVR